MQAVVAIAREDDTTNGTADDSRPEPALVLIARIPKNRSYYRYDTRKHTTKTEMLRLLKSGQQLEIREGDRKGPDVTRLTFLSIIVMVERMGYALATQKELEDILQRAPMI